MRNRETDDGRENRLGWDGVLGEKQERDRETEKRRNRETQTAGERREGGQRVGQDREGKR